MLGEFEKKKKIRPPTLPKPINFFRRYLFKNKAKWAQHVQVRQKKQRYQEFY